MISPEIIKQRINARFECVLHQTPSGESRAFVCVCCDEFLVPLDVKVFSLCGLKAVKHILTPSQWNAVPPCIAACYRYSGDCGAVDNTGSYSLFLGTNHSENASKWMKNRSNSTESSKQIHTVNTNYKVAAQQLEAASLRNPATCHSTAERMAIDLKQQVAVLTQTLTHSLTHSDPKTVLSSKL